MLHIPVRIKVISERKKGWTASGGNQEGAAKMGIGLMRLRVHLLSAPGAGALRR